MYNQSMIQVRIPTLLRKLTDNKDLVACAGATVGEVLDDLEKQHSGIQERIYDKDKQLRQFVLVYLNDEDVRFAQGKTTTVKDGDEISIIPAISGG